MTEMRKRAREFYQGQKMSDSAEGTARIAPGSPGYVWLFTTDRSNGHENAIEARLVLSHEQARELAKRINAMVDECEAIR